MKIPALEIKGIGEKTEALFQKLGVNTAGDLLRFYPRAYDIYEDPVTVSELEEGTVAAVGSMFEISRCRRTGN